MLNYQRLTFVALHKPEKQCVPVSIFHPVLTHSSLARPLYHIVFFPAVLPEQEFGGNKRFVHGYVIYAYNKNIFIHI